VPAHARESLKDGDGAQRLVPSLRKTSRGGKTPEECSRGQNVFDFLCTGLLPWGVSGAPGAFGTHRGQHVFDFLCAGLLPWNVPGLVPPTFLTVGLRSRRPRRAMSASQQRCPPLS